MRTFWMAVGVSSLWACGDKGASNETDTTASDADTDTDADSDSDTDSDADADADSDTDADADTGTGTLDTGTGPGTGRTPGCAPEWVVTYPDDSNCESDLSERDVYAGGPPYFFQVNTYDAAGLLASASYSDSQQGYQKDEIHYYTRDPLTTDVSQEDVDLGQDGTIDYSILYTYTYDVDGNVTHAELVTTDGTGTVTGESIVDQAFGTCGIELVQWDNDGNGSVDDTYTITYYTDGWDRDTDIDTDGVIDSHEDYYADAVTGQPQTYESNNDPAHPGVDLTYDFLAFAADNQDLSLGGIDSVDVGGGTYLDLDLAVDWTYDADGHETQYEVTLAYGAYGTLYDVLDTTTWDCTP